MSSLIDLTVLEKVQIVGMLLFVVELIVFLIDSSVLNKNEGLVIVRPRKISTYIGMFMSLFAVWVCNIVADSCKSLVDVYMLSGLGISMIVFGAFLVVLRLPKFYTYVLDNKTLFVYKFFLIRKEVRITEIERVEQKHDGIKLYLKNNKTIFIDYMFDNQEYLKKVLRCNGINMS